MKVIIEDKDSKEIEPGTALMDLVPPYIQDHQHPIVLASVDNRLVDLWYEPVRDCRIRFIDLGTIDGIKSYRHSLVFLLLRAFKEEFPQINLIVAHSLGRSLYCRPDNNDQITEQMLSRVEARMRQTVLKDERFVRTGMPRNEAIREMKENGQMDKVRLLQWIRQETIHVYAFGGMKDHFFMPLIPSSGYLQHFTVERFREGVLVNFPRHSMPSKVVPVTRYDKLVDIWEESEHWTRILNISDVGALNEAIASNQIDDIIKISEALHEKKIAYVADSIALQKPRPRLILIAGPSSSGKTTFSKRLSIQLRVNGIIPHTIEMDDYFVPRSETPRLPNGDYDYENLQALDIELFNRHLNDLLEGKEVEIPKYDFSTGRRRPSGRFIRLNSHEILIIEGIHGLNEAATPKIHKDVKFKIYVSALSHLNIDNHNRISTTDTRLLRRIVRDSHFRSYTALDTLRRWPLVREGEDRWIFPYQDECNTMFNSALVYEQAVLKGFAVPVLLKIPRTEPEYSEARRLVDTLSCFMEVSTAEVPNTSILREFVGGSSFRY